MMSTLAAYAIIGTAALVLGGGAVSLEAWFSTRRFTRPGDRADDEAWAWEQKLRADPDLRSAVRDVKEWLRR